MGALGFHHNARRDDRRGTDTETNRCKHDVRSRPDRQILLSDMWIPRTKDQSSRQSCQGYYRPRVSAWAHETDDPNQPMRHVTVLHRHPIKSAQGCSTSCDLTRGKEPWHTRKLKSGRPNCQRVRKGQDRTCTLHDRLSKGFGDDGGGEGQQSNRLGVDSEHGSSQSLTPKNSN
jgi:hypothetical protein